MKLLSSRELDPITGGKSPFKFIAVAIIKTVEYAFDQWRTSRERKYSRYQELCIVESISPDKPDKI